MLLNTLSKLIKQNLSRLARQCVFIDGSSTAPPCGMPAAYPKEPLRLRDFLQAGVSTHFAAKLFSYTVTVERFLIGRVFFLSPQVTQQQDYPPVCESFQVYESLSFCSFASNQLKMAVWVNSLATFWILLIKVRTSGQKQCNMMKHGEIGERGVGTDRLTWRVGRAVD